MHTSQTPAASPLIDLTVHDADYMRSTDNPLIGHIWVWYEHETPNKKEGEDLEQIDACVFDFMNYLRTVRGLHYETIEQYWYDRKLMPKARDKHVEEYLEYRANNISQRN